MNNRILITGGSGLLGQELLLIDPNLIAPTSMELNVCSESSIVIAAEKYNPDIIIHLAAATKPPMHEENTEKGLSVNISGTTNIASVCLKKNIRLVYTSSDYLYSGPGFHHEDEAILPLKNFYISKLGGECAVRLCPNSLVLRLSFGPVPFPWEKVYRDQMTSKLYVDEIAPLVLAAAKSSATGIMNIGGPATTLEQYAKRTRGGMLLTEAPDWVPKDLRLNIDYMKKTLGITDENSLLKHNVLDK